MLIAPIFAAAMLDPAAVSAVPPTYWSAFSSWQEIVSGLAWGLGYFGMPHIIIRYMSLKSQAELKKSAKIGISWTVLIVVFAALVGVIGRLFLGYDEAINSNSLVFISMVRRIFPGLISGVLLSAVLAASMSTADSQLLSAASAFASDVYKPVIRKNKVSDREMLWAGRLVVLGVAAVALLIASNPNTGSIMALVSNAWGVFGAAFGPTIMLSLFWRRFNFKGAVAGILTGAFVDIGWFAFLSSTGIYELAPGFLAAPSPPSPSRSVRKSPPNRWRPSSTRRFPIPNKPFFAQGRGRAANAALPRFICPRHGGEDRGTEKRGEKGASETAHCPQETSKPSGVTGSVTCPDALMMNCA